MKLSSLVALAIGVTLSTGLSAGQLPGDSVYQLPGEWRNQTADTLHLADLQGKRQLLAMVYTDCEHTCPVIVNNMKQVQQRMDDSECQRTGYVLVSFTPETDTPEKLSKFSEQYGLDTSCWTLLSGSDPQVRQLAMALSIKYAVKDSGYVAHSNVMTVLDERGREVGQFSGMSKGVEPAAKAMQVE